MKNLFLALTLLLSFTTLASDHVGESSVYEIKRYDTGDIGIYRSTLTSFDSNRGTYNRLSTEEYGSSRAVSIKIIKDEDVWTHAKAAEALGNCQNNNGTIEEIEVLGGKHEACKMPVAGQAALIQELQNILGQELDLEEATVWIGDFAATGIARLSKESLHLEILETHWNN